MNGRTGWMGRTAAAVVVLTLLATDAVSAQSAPAGAAAGTSAARVAAAVQDALARPADAAAVDALLRMNQFEDTMTPSQFRRQLETIAAARGLHPSAALLARYLQAKQLRRTDGLAAARPRFADQGFVQSWSVVGPFDNEGRKGATAVYGPENESLDPAILDHTYDGKERPVAWLPAEAHLARVPFERWLYPVANTCAYAYATVRTPRALDARVWAGADGALAVWVGGRRALSDERYFAAFPDRLAADVALPAGVVPLLVKVCGEHGSMAFFLRLTDRSGKPLRGTLEPRLRDGETPVAPSVEPVPFETAYLELARRAEDGSAEDRLIAGRTLHLSNTVDPTDNQAEKLLERAVEESPSAEAFYWLMRASTDGVKASRAADKVALLAGDQSYLLAEAAARRLGSLGVRAADPLSRQALAAPGGADDPAVMTVRAMVLQSRGLSGACSALVADWLSGHPAVPIVLRQQRSCLQAEGRTQEADALRDAMAPTNRADPDLRLEPLRLLAARGETGAVGTLAAALVADFPDDLGTLQQVATQLEVAGAGDEAVETLRRLAAECPQNPTLAASLGRTLEDLGRRDEAVEPYRRAVELEPQNQPLAQYLEFLDERESLEQRWAVDTATLAEPIAAARRSLDGLAPAERDELRRGRVLLRQEVHQIHPNGLSSRFGQSFTFVQTEDGAEQFRYAQVPFTPGEEDFELLRAVVLKPDGHTEDFESHFPVSYGGGGSYFSDAGAEAIGYPRLGVGDVLELRWRIDGRSRQNKFGEHFSNEIAVLTTEPTDRFLYALVAPETKELYVHVPDGLGFAEDVRTEAGETVRRYEAHDLPGIPEEPAGPPFPELAQPIQVSTFQDWHALARWWWGLVKDQLQPDETIRQRVAEIVAGTTDPEQVVARVFDWVIRNTRYVAMEFGIHGWKPYRAHEVVSRGFGDCKDKGSLIYTMLAAAGVEARLVLLRSRYYRGRPVSEFPSLGQFDHLITYIPSLDLFVDGTMTLASYTELPPMDRGALALIVGPDDERLVTTPLEPRGPDRIETAFEHDVQPDGSATTHAVIRSTGAYAQIFRGPLQAAETRRQRAEELAGTIYPGFVLGDFTVDGLDDFSAPLVLTAEAQVPQLATGGVGAFSLRADRPEDLARTFAGLAQRELDVELGQAVHKTHDLVYRLPAGARDIRVPEGREVHDGARSFLMTVTSSGTEVHVRWVLDIPDPRIPVADYAAFRTFCAAVDTALAEPITYAIP